MESPTEELLVLKSPNIYTSDGKTISGYIVVRNGIIAEVTESYPDNLPFDVKITEGEWIAPGFVDLHFHGCGGASSVEEYWLSDYSVQNVIQYGTTSCLATLTFSKEKESQDLTKEIISLLRGKVGKYFPNQAVIEGIHAEGPIIRCRGALPSAIITTLDDFKSFVDDMPLLKVMTISPSIEFQNGCERIKYLFEKNVLVALGHDTQCGEEEILHILKLAHEYNRPLHVTHLFNVTKFHHRDVSMVNLSLLSNFPNLDKYQNIVEPSVEIIGDFIHVHPLVVHLALQVKNKKKVCFITDAIADCHNRDQHEHGITMGGRKLSISEQGVFLENTTKMAGSSANQLEMFYNLINVLKVPIAEAILMQSENPAKFIGVDHVGTIEVGKHANFIIFNREMKITSVILKGNFVVFQNPENQPVPENL